MISIGNASLCEFLFFASVVLHIFVWCVHLSVCSVVIILGPIAWRKYSAWRQDKATSSSSGNVAKQPWLSFPTPLFLPSNLLLTATFLALIVLHLSYLFHPSNVLSRSDLFLLTKTDVTTSVAAVRSRVASMTFEELGWRREWGEEGLETLLRRLSSFEGRKLHLMIGTSPFLSCHFCSTSKDYILYSISDQLWQYSTNLVLFGLLTCHFGSLEVFDEIVFSLIHLATKRDFRPVHIQSDPLSSPSNVQLRPHGYGYRTPILYLMTIFALAQAAVFLGLLNVSFGQGRWDHWHANFNVAFHAVLLACAALIYFGQRVPHMPAMLEIANLIKFARLHTDQTLAHVQAMHLTNQVIWTDTGLREHVSKWYDARAESLGQLTSDEAIGSLYTRAQQSGVDASSLRSLSQAAAKSMWEGAQPTCQEWERSLPLQATTGREQSQDATASLD